jgi:nucleoside-diphosphate-sugar epimerase
MKRRQDAMKVLITGASGRIGRHLVEEGRDRGWELRLLQRGVSQPVPAPEGVKIVAGSVSNVADVCAAMADVDTVCHLAALMPPASNDELFETNVRGTLNVLEATRASSTRPRLLFASSDATYGTGHSDRAYPEAINETVTPRPTNFYGVTKVACEQIVADYSRLFGLKYLILRYCWVFRAEEVLDLFSVETWAEFLPETRLREFASVHPEPVPVLFDGDGNFFSDHIVDARDAARATALAVEASELSEEAINICGPAAFRYVDISPRVAEALGRPLAQIKLPTFRAYSLDTSKAERLLGFRGSFDISAMLDEALALREGVL